jgi:hypothetical protein
MTTLHFPTTRLENGANDMMRGDMGGRGLGGRRRRSVIPLTPPNPTQPTPIHVSRLWTPSWTLDGARSGISTRVCAAGGG